MIGSLLQVEGRFCSGQLLVGRDLAMRWSCIFVWELFSGLFDDQGDLKMEWEFCVVD